MRRVVVDSFISGQQAPQQKKHGEVPSIQHSYRKKTTLYSECVNQCPPSYKAIIRMVIASVMSKQRFIIKHGIIGAVVGSINIAIDMCQAKDAWPQKNTWRSFIYSYWHYLCRKNIRCYTAIFRLCFCLRLYIKSASAFWCWDGSTCRLCKIHSLLHHIHTPHMIYTQ